MENVLFRFALFFLGCAIVVRIVTFFSYALSVKLRGVAQFCMHWAVISEIVGLGIKFGLSFLANVILGIATSAVCVFVFPPALEGYRHWRFIQETNKIFNRMEKVKNAKK